MGLILLDAGVLIGFLDAEDAHHADARNVLAGAQAHGHRLGLPASALAESLVAPSRRGSESVRLVLDFVARFPIEVIVLDDRMAVDAAALRAVHRSLRLPDALVIATARVAEATEVVTTDRGWPSRQALELNAELTVLG